MVLILRIFVAKYLNIGDELFAFVDKLCLGVPLEILGEVFAYAFQKLYFLYVLLIPFPYHLLPFLHLLVEFFDNGDEILFDVVLLLLHTQMQFLNFKPHVVVTLPIPFYFLIEFCQLIQYFILVILVYFV